MDNLCLQTSRNDLSNYYRQTRLHMKGLPRTCLLMDWACNLLGIHKPHLPHIGLFLCLKYHLGRLLQHDKRHLPHHMLFLIHMPGNCLKYIYRGLCYKSCQLCRLDLQCKPPWQCRKCNLLGILKLCLPRIFRLRRLTNLLAGI